MFQQTVLRVAFIDRILRLLQSDIKYLSLSLSKTLLNKYLLTIAVNTLMRSIGKKTDKSLKLGNRLKKEKKRS